MGDNSARCGKAQATLTMRAPSRAIIFGWPERLCAALRSLPRNRKLGRHGEHTVLIGLRGIADVKRQRQLGQIDLARAVLARRHQLLTVVRFDRQMIDGRIAGC